MVMMSRHRTLEINRRKFLHGALTAGTFAIATRATSLALQRRFAPVKVARNRIIREVVGLRPYRAPGFMVGGERIGRKLLVHNYGHGVPCCAIFTVPVGGS
jgi:D-amino-acid oxidase